MAWATPSHIARSARPNAEIARATGPGPERAGARRVEDLIGALGARAALVPVERDEVEREAADREEGVRVEDVPDAGLRGVPEVRARGGALDRLAMSREYPWVAGIPGVTAVTRVVRDRL